MNRYSVIALVLLATTAVDAAEKNLERTFAASPGGALVVDADSASVQVSGGTTNQVVVRMTARGPDDQLASMTMDASANADGVTVTMRRHTEKSWFKWGSWNSDGRILVTVPKNYRISVRTSGSDVELHDTVGAATLRTSGGSISAKNVTGNVEARTSGGGIRAEEIRGDVDAGTSGGDVHLLHVDGKILGRTSGGSVICSLVGTNRGITTTTSGGSIELTLPKATTAQIEASLSGGDFRSDLPITADRKTDTHVQGTINGGGQPIEARTSGGDISLRAAN